jgi:hypothetical protein
LMTGMSDWKEHERRLCSDKKRHMPLNTTWISPWPWARGHDARATRHRDRRRIPRDVDKVPWRTKQAGWRMGWLDGLTENLITSIPCWWLRGRPRAQRLGGRGGQAGSAWQGPAVDRVRA